MMNFVFKIDDFDDQAASGGSSASGEGDISLPLVGVATVVFG